jgi:hypothetical protein
MRKRMVIMLSVMGLLIVGLGMMKFLQIRAAIAAGASWQPPRQITTSWPRRRVADHAERDRHRAGDEQRDT